MSKLDWFSGGNERGGQAIMLIETLLADLSQESKALQKVLMDYRERLMEQGASVPLILSEMNLEISRAIRQEGFSLSKDQQNILKKLRSLSNIRYGY